MIRRVKPFLMSLSSSTQWATILRSAAALALLGACRNASPDVPIVDASYPSEVSDSGADSLETDTSIVESGGESDSGIDASDLPDNASSADRDAAEASADGPNEAESGTIPTTRLFLATQSPTCLACAMGTNAAGITCLEPNDDNSNTGGVCEAVQGLSRTPGLSEEDLCIETLQRIFTSKCAADGQLTPCLCGNTDPTRCLGGDEDPTGPVYSIYTNDFGINIRDIMNNFTVTTFGAGQADSIVKCLGSLCVDECLGNATGSAADGGGP
jgi:hypothetical protein